MMFDRTTGRNPNRLSSAKFLCQPWRVVLAEGSFVLAISFLIAGALGQIGLARASRRYRRSWGIRTRA